MEKTVVITQSNYIPWPGYFNLIRHADTVVFLDSVQYTRRDWRNRNRIKTPQGAQWLTIAVHNKGAFDQSIAAMRIADANWAKKHIQTIDLNYRRASAFGDVAPWLFDRLTEVSQFAMLSEVNRFLIAAMCERLGIRTTLLLDRDILPIDKMGQLDATDRLIALAKIAGATRYLSGPAAKDYLDTARFARHGIGVDWMNYGTGPSYPQCWGPFESHLSIIDLLLNCGAEAIGYLKDEPPIESALSRA